MNQKEQQQLTNWVLTKKKEHEQNAIAFQGEEKGYPLYFALQEASVPFYLYSASKDGDHSIYYGVDDEVIELELTPYDFGDEKRMMVKIMEKRALKFEEKIQ